MQSGLAFAVTYFFFALVIVSEAIRVLARRNNKNEAHPEGGFALSLPVTLGACIICASLVSFGVFDSFGFFEIPTVVGVLIAAFVIDLRRTGERVEASGARRGLLAALNRLSLIVFQLACAGCAVVLLGVIFTRLSATELVLSLVLLFLAAIPYIYDAYNDWKRHKLSDGKPEPYFFSCLDAPRPPLPIVCKMVWTTISCFFILGIVVSLPFQLRFDLQADVIASDASQELGTEVKVSDIRGIPPYESLHANDAYYFFQSLSGTDCYVACVVHKGAPELSRVFYPLDAWGDSIRYYTLTGPRYTIVCLRKWDGGKSFYLNDLTEGEQERRTELLEAGW